MTDSRRRIGLLVPSSNTVMEPDFWRHVPSNVSVLTARMFLEDVTVAAEARMLDEFALPAARDLATARPEAVVFGCTSAGALRGNDYDERLCRDISEVTGVPTLSVIGSARAALKQAHARRIAVLTPYTDAVSGRVARSLEDDGFVVTCLSGLGITSNREIAEVAPEAIAALARARLGPADADAWFISCTNFRAMEAIPLLRAASAKPILTSNQAALDAVLAALGRL